MAHNDPYEPTETNVRYLPCHVRTAEELINFMRREIDRGKRGECPKIVQAVIVYRYEDEALEIACTSGLLSERLGLMEVGKHIMLEQAAGRLSS